MGKSISKVVVIDQNMGRAQVLVDGLREAGIEDVTLIRNGENLLTKVVALDPDVILIDLENPRRDTVEQMLRVSEQVQRPVVMFADESEPDLIRRAVQSGVSAYIVDGLQKARLKSIIEVAVARFNQFETMEGEVARLRQELDDRKVIEKAKGLLMRSRALSEEDAHAFLRRAAMNEKKKIVDIANLVIEANKVGL